jgi:hypothetical protein
MEYTIIKTIYPYGMNGRRRQKGLKNGQTGIGDLDLVSDLIKLSILKPAYKAKYRPSEVAVFWAITLQYHRAL